MKIISNVIYYYYVLKNIFFSGIDLRYTVVYEVFL